MNKKALSPYLIVLPAVIYMLIMIGYPLVRNIFLSFQNVNILNLKSGDSIFIGLANYQKLLATDVFWISLKNTLFYTVFSIIFQFSIGFALALFFSKTFKGSEFLRGILMIAWLIPLTVTAMLFKFLLSSEVGAVNQVLLSLKIITEPIGFLINQKFIMLPIIFTNIWVGVPFNMLMISTGLANLPVDIYESASLDGANRGQQFRYLTIPLLKPVLFSVLMLGFIYTFKVFDLVFVMTGGGPINSSEVLSTLAYRYSFSDFEFSLGAAVSNILFLILFSVSIFYLRLSLKEERNET